MNFALRVALATTLALLGCLPTQAQQVEVKAGQRLFCDTAQQAERYVILYNGNSQATANAVNREENKPTACAVNNLVYVRGREVGTARTSAGFYYRIVQILVVGVVTEDGVESAVPAAFYSVEKLADRDV